MSPQYQADEFFFAVENSFDGVWINDATGRIVYLNKKSEELFGVSAQKVVGTLVSQLEADGSIQNSAMMETIRTRSRCTKHVTATLTGKKLLCTANPVFKQGRIVRFVCNIRDITDESELRLQLDNLRRSLQTQSAEIKELRSRKNLFASENFVFQSKRMQQLNEIVQKAALCQATVLVEGETGVGKGIIARLIHSNSSRKKGPLININCAVIPQNLLESELFGHVKGAFTDASSDKIGLLEMANGGTVFLDEIGELPLSMQSKLLRVLQERTIRRLGSTRTTELDIRIIAATNRDLKRMIQDKEFREDLYYRINIIDIFVPPLRDRKEDITCLVAYFLDRLNKQHGTQKHLSPQMFLVLQNYEWPGNIRELENTIERVYALTGEDEITTQYFPEGTASRPDPAVSAEERISDLLPLKDAVGVFEKQHIISALNRCKSIRRAAACLGLDHTTISRKIARYGITRRFDTTG